MCGHCGCGDTADVIVGSAGHEHVHADGTRHSHPHSHTHHQHAEGATLVELQTRILAKNDSMAARNRAWFAGREILAINLVSSPGAGKTTLLERTIRDVQAGHAIGVLEGDQATTHDSDRIRATRAPDNQVHTGTA